MDAGAGRQHDEQPPAKRPRTDSPPEERSFDVPAEIAPGTRVEIFHRTEGVAMGWYAAEVSSVDADAKLLEVRYVGCSPGQSVEWLTYSGNHDLAFLPMQAPAATQPAPTHAAAVLPSQSAAASGAASAAASPQAGQKDARSMDVDTTVAEGGGEGTEDDEDEQNEEEEEEQSAAAAAPAAASASTSIYVEEISLLDSDEEDGVVTTRTIEGPAAAAAVTLIASDSDGSDDEEQGAEGVVVKGASASDYPHARCNCTLRRFHVDRCRTVPTDKQNATTCKNCYCFVCDVPASECSRWEDPIGNEAELSEDGQRLAIAKTSHCLAADKTEEWVQVRKAGKHAWLKESPLYAHLGGQCYGASADYTVTGLLAFEGFTHPLSVASLDAVKYNTMRSVEESLSHALTHCAALSLRTHAESCQVHNKDWKDVSGVPPSTGLALENYDLGGYRFKVLQEKESVGVAIAIADSLTAIAVRHSWRPAARGGAVGQTEANSKHFRRLIGKIDSAWARALLAEGVSDATRAVAKTRLADLTASAAEPAIWSLVAANQAAQNGWMPRDEGRTSPHVARLAEHRRVVAVRLEHLCARRQWNNALDYAAEADPTQVPALLVKSGQVLQGVNNLISKPQVRPPYGWPDQNGKMETQEDIAARERNNFPGAAPAPEYFEQAKRLRAAPGVELGAAATLASLPELKRSPLSGLLLALCAISATPVALYERSPELTSNYRKMAHLALACVLKGGDGAGNAGAAAGDGPALLTPEEKTRRGAKGRDGPDAMRFERLSNDIVSDGGGLPPIGLGAGCSNRLRELIKTLREDMSMDWDSKKDQGTTETTSDDHLQWCGEMAAELVVAACLRGLWEPMLCADRGDVEHWPSHLREQGFNGTGGEDNDLNRRLGYKGDGIIPSDEEEETKNQKEERRSTATPSTANGNLGADAPQPPHPSAPSEEDVALRPLTEEPSEEDLFWSTLLDLKDCSALDTADSAAAGAQQRQPAVAAAAAAAAPPPPVVRAAIPSTSPWGSHPWNTGMVPKQQNTYPRGRCPTLTAPPLAALRSLAEAAMELGDARSAVHLLRPLIWCCADLGGPAIAACCEKAGKQNHGAGSSHSEGAATDELRKCLQFVMFELVPQVGPAAFDRTVMVPPYHAAWPHVDLAASGGYVWPPAPKPQRDDENHVRVEMPWPVFAKKEWRALISLRSLGMLAAQLQQDPQSNGALAPPQGSASAAAAVAAPAGAEAESSDLKLVADSASASASARAKVKAKAANDEMYAIAVRNAATSAAFFAAKSAKGKRGKDLPAGLAILRKIVPKADRVPASFHINADARVGGAGGSPLSSAQEQLMVFLADACVEKLMAAVKAREAASPQAGPNAAAAAAPAAAAAAAAAAAGGTGMLELDLARRIALSCFFTKPSPKSLEHLQTAWMGAGGDVVPQAASSWAAKEQQLVQQLTLHTVPSTQNQVLAPQVSTPLEDADYCERLAALGWLRAWDGLRETALQWWKQGGGSRSYTRSVPALRPIDCGAACLFVLTGVATPQQLLEIGRRSLNLRGYPLVAGLLPGQKSPQLRGVLKPEPAAAAASASHASVVASGGSASVPASAQQKQKNVQNKSVLSEASLVAFCVSAVVPYCIEVIRAVELGEVMALTSGNCSVFDGLMRWVLLLQSPQVGQLQQQQQALLATVNEITQRVAAAAASEKVSATRKATIVAWLQLACGWSIVAAKGQGHTASDAQSTWRNHTLALFIKAVKKKSALVKAVKAEFLLTPAATAGQQWKDPREGEWPFERERG